MASGDPSIGLRFDSPGVLNLAECSAMHESVPVRTAALADEFTQRIVAAPTVDDEATSLPFSADVYGCKRPAPACLAKAERTLIDATSGVVKRDGKNLSVNPASGQPITFVDWTMQSSKTADGDSERHWYLGTLPGSGYARVEVQFGHDAPGSFLINPANGKITFVHNAADVAGAAPDGRHLMTLNTLNPPLCIRVAALDPAGPTLQLQCEVGKDIDHVETMFKGWHDAHAFDIALVVRASRSKLAHRIALRISQDDKAWQLAASDLAQLDAIGFACRSRSR